MSSEWVEDYLKTQTRQAENLNQEATGVLGAENYRQGGGGQSSQAQQPVSAQTLTGPAPLLLFTLLALAGLVALMINLARRQGPAPSEEK